MTHGHPRLRLGPGQLPAPTRRPRPSPPSSASRSTSASVNANEKSHLDNKIAKANSSASSKTTPNGNVTAAESAIASNSGSRI